MNDFVYFDKYHIRYPPHLVLPLQQEFHHQDGPSLLEIFLFSVLLQYLQYFSKVNNIHISHKDHQKLRFNCYEFNNFKRSIFLL